MSEQKMWALRRRSDKVLRLVSSDKEEVKRRAINLTVPVRFADVDNHESIWADILKKNDIVPVTVTYKPRGAWIKFAAGGVLVDDILHEPKDAEIKDKSFVWCEEQP